MTIWKIKCPWKSREFRSFPIPVRETCIEVKFFPLSISFPILNKIKLWCSRCSRCGVRFRWGYVPCCNAKYAGLFHFSCLDDLFREARDGKR